MESKTQGLETKLIVNNGDEKVIVPIHIRDITVFDNLGEETIITIKVVISKREELGKWGKILAILPE